MNTIYDFNQLHESIINALEDSISDYEMLFSEEEWVYESPVKIDTPSERRAKAINNFLDGMVYIPSTNANIRDYNIMDMANHFDDIPAPTCSHDFCMHKSINSNVTEELGFGIFMFTKISQAVSLVDYVSSATGYKFEIALEEEIIWASRLARRLSRLIPGAPGGSFYDRNSPVLAVDKDGNYEMIIYNDKWGEKISILKTDDWNESYSFCVVCKSDKFIDKQLITLENKINEDIEDEEEKVSLKRA